MRTELYYTRYDAESAACAFAADHGGLVVGMDFMELPLRGELDPSRVDFTDLRYLRRVDWNPERVYAVRVVDRDTREDVGLFGYVEDEID